MKSRPYGLSPAHYRPALLLAAILLALLAGCAVQPAPKPYFVDKALHAEIPDTSVKAIRWQTEEPGFGISYKVPLGTPREKMFGVKHLENEGRKIVGDYGLIQTGFGKRIFFTSITVIMTFNENAYSLETMLDFKGRSPEEWLGSANAETYAIFRLWELGYGSLSEKQAFLEPQRILTIDGRLAHLFTWRRFSTDGTGMYLHSNLRLPTPGYNLDFIFSAEYERTPDGEAALAFARELWEEVLSSIKVEGEARPFKHLEQ